jgi:hypothetical protein
MRKRFRAHPLGGDFHAVSSQNLDTTHRCAQSRKTADFLTRNTPPRRICRTQPTSRQMSMRQSLISIAASIWREPAFSSHSSEIRVRICRSRTCRRHRGRQRCVALRSAGRYCFHIRKRRRESQRTQRWPESITAIPRRPTIAPASS